MTTSLLSFFAAATTCCQSAEVAPCDAAVVGFVTPLPGVDAGAAAGGLAVAPQAAAASTRPTAGKSWRSLLGILTVRSRRGESTAQIRPKSMLQSISPLAGTHGVGYSWSSPQTLAPARSTKIGISLCPPLSRLAGQSGPARPSHPPLPRRRPSLGLARRARLLAVGQLGGWLRARCR